MAKEYFLNFPLVEIDISANNSTQKPINITNRFKIRDIIKNNSLLFYTYTVKDGERPDIIAEKYYGDSNYFWLVMMSNNMLDPLYDWVLTEYEFGKYIENKYGSITLSLNGQEYASQNYKYYTGQGYEVDSASYILLSGMAAIGKSTDSLWDYEWDKNEEKRNIFLIGKEYLDIIERELGGII